MCGWASFNVGAEARKLAHVRPLVREFHDGAPGTASMGAARSTCVASHERRMTNVIKRAVSAQPFTQGVRKLCALARR